MGRALSTAVLVLFGSAYAVVLTGVAARGFRPAAFDPLAARPHVVERLIVAKRYEAARPLADELRRSVPNEPQVIEWQAVIARGLNLPVAEVSAWEDYMRVAAAPAAACPSLPDAYAKAGRQADALPAYERCLQLDPRNPDRVFDLAAALAASGKTSEALTRYREAEALDPDNPVIKTRIAALDAEAARR